MLLIGGCESPAGPATGCQALMTEVVNAAHMYAPAGGYARGHMHEPDRSVWSRSASERLQVLSPYDASMDKSLCELLPGCWRC